MDQILYTIISFIGLTQFKEFLLSQSFRSQLSSEDQKQVTKANYHETVTILSNSLKWFSSTFSEKVTQHFGQNITQHVQPMLSKIHTMTSTYFRSSGRVLTLENIVILVVDSEYGPLTSSQQDELLIAALTATEKLSNPEIEASLSDVATTLMIRKSAGLLDEAVEEMMHDADSEELAIASVPGLRATKIKKKVTKTERTLGFDSKNFYLPQPFLDQASPPAIVHGTLTDSQQDKWHLIVMDAIGKSTETDLEIRYHDIVAILREDAVYKELMHKKNGELVTLKKGYVIAPDTQFDRSGFQPKHPTSPLCWVLTQSHVNDLFLAAPRATVECEGAPDCCRTVSESETDGTPDCCGTASGSETDGTPDCCETASGSETDGTPDCCGTASGSETDGTPDCCGTASGIQSQLNDQFLAVQRAPVETDGTPDCCGTASGSETDGTPDCCGTASEIQSQLNDQFLAVQRAPVETDGTPNCCGTASGSETDGTPDCCGTASGSKTDGTQDETSTEEMATTSKGHRIRLSEVGSLCDRSRHFSPFFLVPPPGR